MANVNSVQHTQEAPQGGSSTNLNCAWGTYEIATALSAADTITFFEIPAGATVVGGWLMGDDLDTGIETLEIDVGDASDADRFLNSGVLTGDAVTGVKPEAGINISLFGTLKDGPHTYSSATNVIGTITAAAATGGTGTITLVLLYTYNDARVSPPEKPV